MKTPAIGDRVIFHKKGFKIVKTDAKSTKFEPLVSNPKQRSVKCATAELIFEESLDAWYLDRRLF